jgi:transketolase
MTEQTPAPRDMANAIRALAMDAVEKADSGHPGLPMGMADVATVLFTKFMKFDPLDPHWPDRDRFILSAGHGSMLLYSLLYLTGYPDMTMEQIQNFRQLGSKTAGHPEYGHATGIETTTGPLGQGLGNSVGFAVAERLMQARFGKDVVDHYTYVLCGDGCLMEGIGQEAVSLAGHLGLGKLILFFDNNSITIDGATSLATSEDHLKRFVAAGWHVQAVDGFDQEAITRAIRKAQKVIDKPSMIACKTIIGYGAPTKAGTKEAHGAALGKDEVAGARQNLGWPYPPFEIPEPIFTAWRKIGAKGKSVRRKWVKRHAAMAEADRAEFDRRMAGDIPPIVDETIKAFKNKMAADKPKWATRKSSQEVLEVINPVLPDMLGGSADLTGSNNTKTKTINSQSLSDPSGHYMHYGIREHVMCAAMNGMSLHGGLIPYGGTFMAFTDYCRPSIRLAALMGVRVVYVMTHDSIGLGEDGPTHQPVEHLPALRAIPHLTVMRPADVIETAECWQIAIEAKGKPTVLALSRQNLPTLRSAGDENLCKRGAYILAGDASADVRLIASGSEVQLAMEARDMLAKDGIPAAVVSMPSWELFEAQDVSYRTDVMGPEGTVRVACEAAEKFGWERWLGAKGAFVGMKGFGASGKIDDVYKHFGITAEAIAEAARGLAR